MPSIDRHNHQAFRFPLGWESSPLFAAIVMHSADETTGGAIETREKKLEENRVSFVLGIWVFGTRSCEDSFFIYRCVTYFPFYHAIFMDLVGFRTQRDRRFFFLSLSSGRDLVQCSSHILNNDKATIFAFACVVLNGGNCGFSFRSGLSITAELANITEPCKEE